jgi:hypothetical protein
MEIQKKKMGKLLERIAACLAKVVTNEELFHLEVREIQRGKSYRIIIRPHPQRLPRGKVKESISIYTNLEDYPMKVIPLRVQKGTGKRP